MQYHRTAAILSIGDELVLGQTLDTNSRWLSEQLTNAGVLPRLHLTVADDLTAQREALVDLSAKADVIIVSGGLGPTADDLTRQALADAMGAPLVLDEVSLSQVEAWFVARGKVMSELNRTQAMIPRGADAIPNIHGTAPGIRGRIVSGARACETFCLPGPPREMMPMFTSLVLPRLRPDPAMQIHTRVLHTFGIGESDLAQRLGSLMDREANPVVGTTASGGIVSMRLRYRGGDFDDAAVRAMHRCEQACRDAAGVYVFGGGDETLASACVRALQERGATLSVAESCTGGGLGALITQVPSASSVFLGGVLTYSNQSKSLLAGVPESMFVPDAPGAVSAACAIAMAKGVLERIGTTHALSITGIAGPGGGSQAKPVGTVWIGWASSTGGAQARRFFLSGDRQTVRDLAAKSALGMLRLALIGVEATLLRETELVRVSGTGT